MTRQPLLFGGEQITTVQRPLIDLDLPPEAEECCPECARHLVQTVSGYWTCPSGCGKLLCDPRD